MTSSFDKVHDICLVVKNRNLSDGSQMAERLGNRAINQKVAGLIPGCANLLCVLGKIYVIVQKDMFSRVLA